MGKKTQRDQERKGFGRRLLILGQRIAAFGHRASRTQTVELCQLILETIQTQMWYLCSEAIAIEYSEMYRRHFETLEGEWALLRAPITNAELQRTLSRLTDWHTVFQRDSRFEGVVFPDRINEILDELEIDTSQMPPTPSPLRPAEGAPGQRRQVFAFEDPAHAGPPTGHVLRRSASGWPTTRPSFDTSSPPVHVPAAQQHLAAMREQQQFAAMQHQHQAGATREQQRTATRQQQRQIAEMQEHQQRQHAAPSSGSKGSGAKGHKKNAFSFDLFGSKLDLKLPGTKRKSSDQGSTHSSSTTGRSQASSSQPSRSQLSPSPSGGGYGMNMPPAYHRYAATMIDLRPETYDQALAETYDQALAIEAHNQQVQDLQRRRGLGPGTSAGWPSFGRRQQPAPRQSIDEEDDEEEDDDEDEEEEESYPGKGKGPARYQGPRWDRYGGGGAAGGAAGFPGGQPGSGASYAWR